MPFEGWAIHRLALVHCAHVNSSAADCHNQPLHIRLQTVDRTALWLVFHELFSRHTLWKFSFQLNSAQPCYSQDRRGSIVCVRRSIGD
jgi:hypothetical protein